MMRIEFHDREREIKEIMNILDADPTLITFIYGPINSGKTELINHVISQLPEEYAVFYINLRGRFIRSYEEFLDVLFEIDEERKVENAKEYAKAILKDLKSVGGIPIPTNLFERIFERRERSKDVFRYIENFMSEISEKYAPVLILDEMQVIGDIKIDELLIYKLFNFFIRLTKELHLCHVFAITSDSLFIERVYREAMLEGRSDYVLVDDFDEETSKNFLEKYGFKESEMEIAWHYLGGKPSYLVKLINAKIFGKDVNDVCKKMLNFRTGEIETILKRVNELGATIKIEDREYEVKYERLIEALNKFCEHDEIGMNELDEISKAFLFKKNVIFVDPLERTIKPQSRLDLIAIRDVVKRV